MALAGTALAAAGSFASRPPSSGYVDNSSKLAGGCYAIAAETTGNFLTIVGNEAYGLVGVRARATPFYLKPTGLGTYLLFDRDGELLSVTRHGNSAIVSRSAMPDSSTEWAIARATGTQFTLTSTAGRFRLSATSARTGGLTVQRSGRGRGDQRFAFAPSRGCRDYPEAQVGAFGTPFSGTSRTGKVSGFVDLHVHITADMRAGGQLIYGESFDRYGITQALSAAGDARAHGTARDNHGWPTFTGWPTHDTIVHQQVYYVWLKRSWMAGLRLVVAQTVEDHALCQLQPRRTRTCDEMKSIAGQVQRLREMQDYIDAQSGGRGRGWFRLVYDPAQARRVIAAGKLAVVIGVESSDPFGCSEFKGKPQCTKADVNRGLDEFARLGVRTMFPIHWVDNAFAGVALQSGGTGSVIDSLQQTQTGQPFSTEPCTRAGEIERTSATAAPRCNARGLTDLGAYLIRRMIEKHMLIEADHMSEKTRDAVLAIAAANHYPLVSSHNGTGGAWSDSQLRSLYDGGGIAAVTPATAPTLADKVLALSRDRSRRYYFGVGIGTDTGGLGGQPAARGRPPLTEHHDSRSRRARRA
jgi:microsomal dipeptidase-like Zn-dependent dipeptidase